MPWLIEYNYNTGNSFKTQRGLKGILEIEWNDLTVAKQNLQRIKEHYRQYEKLNGYNREDNQTILKGNKGKDWFVYKAHLMAYDPKDVDKSSYKWFSIDKKEVSRCLRKGYVVESFIDTDAATYQVILYTDEGKKFQMSAPYCGYFERLNSARIIAKTPDESDMEVEF